MSGITAINTHDKKTSWNEFKIAINTGNQQKIQLKVVHHTTKVSTSKEYSQLLSAISNSKSFAKEACTEFIQKQDSDIFIFILLLYFLMDWYRLKSVG